MDGLIAVAITSGFKNLNAHAPQPEVPIKPEGEYDID